MYIREREEDFKSIHLKRVFISRDLLVRHASEVYTRVIFNKVQDEYNATLQYRSEILNKDGHENTYKVRWSVSEKVIEEFTVKINEVTIMGVCNCHKFEFVCIPCRHLHHILVLRFYVVDIPSHFIMERWTKQANRSEVLGLDGLAMNDGKSTGIEAMRISHYCRLPTELAYMLGKSEKAYDVAIDLLNQAFEQVRLVDVVELGKEHGKDVEECADIEPLVVNSSCSVLAVVANEESCASSPAKKIGDPRKFPTKGKENEIIESNSRFKSGIEMNRKPRKCKTCGG